MSDHPPQHMRVVLEIAPDLTLRADREGAYFIVGPDPSAGSHILINDPRSVLPAPSLPVSAFQAGYLLARAGAR